LKPVICRRNTYEQNICQRLNEYVFFERYRERVCWHPWSRSRGISWIGSVSEGGFFVRLRFIRVLATPVPLDARKKIIASRASEYQLDNTYWELENEWIEPEGPPFNVMYRSCQEAEKEVPPASCTACGFSWIHDCVLFQPEAGQESGGPQ
jgi:hypothetical protein